MRVLPLLLLFACASEDPDDDDGGTRIDPGQGDDDDDDDVVVDDFDPASDPGVLLWLNADHVDVGSGQEVRNWADSSPSGADGFAADTTTSPIYSGELVWFDGVDDGIVATTGTVPGAHTVAAAWRADGVSSGAWVFALQPSPEDFAGFTYRNGGLIGWESWSAGAGGFVASDSQHVDAAMHVFVGTSDPSTGALQLFVDGVAAQTTSSVAPDRSRAGWELGGMSSFGRTSMGVGEVLVFSRVLTSSERLSVEAYLTERWLP